MQTTTFHFQNKLLAALPAAEYTRLAPFLEWVAMPLGRTLYDPGVLMRHVYFPCTCVVSLMCPLENGAAPEVAVVGEEGIVGVALFMGGESTSGWAVVQSAGFAYRLRSEFMKSEFNQGGAIQQLLLRYTQALLTQMAQTTVCNRHHLLEQQLCRWLLMRLDRLHDHDLVITQQLIANMLGVRREGVTEAVGKLQKAGLIESRRGHITVLDQKGLETRVCECYGVVKKEYGRLLKDIGVSRSLVCPLEARPRLPQSQFMESIYGAS